MADKQWRFRIHDSSTTAIEHTITSSNLASAPTVGGQNILPLEGRTYTRPSQVQVLDDNDFFTSKLADSGGRMVLLRRLADMQVSVDGGAFNTLYTGRIADIQDRVSYYDVTLHDERLLERTFTLFKKVGAVLGVGSSSHYAGTLLVPPGVDGEYGNFRRSFLHVGVGDNTTEGNLRRVSLDRIALADIGVNHRDVVGTEIATLVRDDLKEELTFDVNTTVGNFNTLRCRINGQEHEVFGLGFRRPVDDDELTDDFDIITGNTAQTNITAWVVSTSTPATVTEAKLHMPDHEPTELMPLHIGGAEGIHPFQLVKDVYDEIGLRYSTAAIQSLIDDEFYDTITLRIQGPRQAAEFLDEAVYQPFGVIPFIDKDGQVAPKSVHLPQSSDVNDDITTLTELTSTEIAQQPSWQYDGREQVTRLRLLYMQETEVTIEQLQRIIEYGGITGFQSQRIIKYADVGDKTGFGADLIRQDEREIIVDHDRSSEFAAPFEKTIRLDGFHRQQNVVYTVPVTNRLIVNPGADKWANVLKREVFDRYGDGPIRGRLIPTSSGVDIPPGDLARITLATFPNPSTQGRGGTRIVQVLGRTEAPAGPEYEWLDVGPNLQPLAAPTITLTTGGTRRPNHTLIAALTGLSTGSGWLIQINESSDLPVLPSLLWQQTREGTTAGSTSISLTGLKSGTKYWARAIQTAPNRIRSAWSTAANSTTPTLTAPSALASSTITGTTLNLDWTNGETDYAIEIEVDQASVCTSTNLTSIDTVPRLTTRYKMRNLTLDSTHCTSVRHLDRFGGVSARATLLVQMTNTQPAAPNIKALDLAQGSTC